MNLSEIQVDVAALRHNLAALKELVPRGMDVVAVVKANAYGHGLEEVVGALDGQVEAFQLDDLDELRRLRGLTQTRAIVLGHVPPDGIAEAAALGGELALFDPWQVPAFARHGVVAHLEIDALLGRLGRTPDDLDEMVALLRGHPGLRLAGVYGHFGNIEDTTDQTHAYAQIEAFEAGLARVRELAPEAALHMSATSGLLTIEPVRRGYGLVRLGVGLYGLYPSAPLSRTHAFLGLRPAMRWITHLAQVKDLPKGHPVGYGLAFVTTRAMRVGIVPQGYSDGVDRGLSNVGEVLVRGARCPILGRVAMNMFTVDVSHVPEAAAHDEVVLLGAQGEDAITAEEIAAKLGTIHYEVVARISPQLPRVLG